MLTAPSIAPNMFNTIEYMEEDQEVLSALPPEIHRYAFEHFSYRDMDIAHGHVLDFHDIIGNLYKNHDITGIAALLTWKSSLVDIVFAYCSYFGHVEVLAWIHATFSYTIPHGAMLLACQQGQLDVVDFLCSNGSDICMLDQAASNGHLHILQYFHNKYPDACQYTYKAMSGAARNGHVRVVMFLYNHGVECETEALLEAARNGHTDVVKHLIKYYHEEGCEAKAFSEALRKGQLGVVQFLSVHYIRTNGYKDS